MRKIPMVLAMAAIVLTVQPAFAQDSTATGGFGGGRLAGRMGGQHQPGQMLQQMDTDGNGSVSKQEFMAAAEARFAKMDKNGDGVLSKDDMPEGGARRRPGAGGDAPVPDVTVDPAQ